VYDTVMTAQSTVTQALVAGASKAITTRKLGTGEVLFLAGEFGIDLPANYDNEIKDRTAYILPSELSEGHATLLSEIFGEMALADRAVPRDDVELSLMRNAAGDLLLFAINWEEHATSVALTLPHEATGTGEGFAVGASGAVTEKALDAETGTLDLSPQEAVVLRFSAQ